MKKDILQFSLLFNQVELPLLITDTRDIILYCNKAYATFCNSTVDELIGYSVEEEMRNKGIQIDFEPVAKIAKREKKRQSVFIYHENEGNTERYYIQCFPIFDTSRDNIKYFVLVFVNLDIFASDRHVSIFGNSRSSFMHLNSDDFYEIRKIIGQPDKINDLYALIRTISNSNIPVLITGETGVGKELIAELIYKSSSRKSKPMVTINCAAISESLLESEMFGYVKGAFTGADKNGREGLLAKADFGTFFLDEIGELPMHLQSKLLRAIQYGEFYPVGSNIPSHVDVRFIAATNRNLDEMVKQGTFRPDLYYRLNFLNIDIPPLRKRPEDLPLYISYFLESLSKKYGNDYSISDDAVELLSKYSWPGNVRELENKMECLSLLASEKGRITVNTIKSLEKFDKTSLFFQDDNSSPVNSDKELGLNEKISNYEKQLISEALSKSKTDLEAAQLLKISAPTLSRKIKQYGLK